MQALNNPVVISNQKGKLVITPEARFDYFTCIQLEAAFLELLVNSQQPEIIVDLSNVVFIDMPAIKLMVNLVNSTEQCGGTCKFTNASDKIRIILDITGTQLSNVHYVTNEEN